MFFSVYFLNADTGYAVGIFGAIIKTTDGGGYPLGVDKLHPASDLLKIFPDPASDKIIAETSETSSSGTLSILNLNGQEFMQETINKSSAQIDISTLPCGVYVVKLTGERSVQVAKFVKE
jgi:hypothetical protein